MSFEDVRLEQREGLHSVSAWACLAAQQATNLEKRVDRDGALVGKSDIAIVLALLNYALDVAKKLYEEAL
jgi:hypothetical protein